MRGRFILGVSGPVVLGAFVLLASPRADRPVPAVAPPPRPPQPQHHGSPPASPRASPAPPAPPSDASATTSPDTARLSARDERLVRSAGLVRGGTSAAARLLATHSAEELRLLARFEALAGGTSPALVELIERRRAGASAPDLVEAATRLFAGDPLGRAAALEWVRTTATTDRPPAPSGAPVLLPLRAVEPR